MDEGFSQPSVGKGKKTGKGNRKVGRQLKKPAQKRYTSMQRWKENKVKRIVKQMRKHPNWKPYNLSSDIERMVEERMSK